MTPENNNQDQSELAALKNQVFTLLLALIVVSGTLTVFLYRQSSLASKDLAQATQVNTVVTHNAVVLQEFVSKLVAYGEKHPEFQPLLKKYGLPPQKAGVITKPAK